MKNTSVRVLRSIPELFEWRAQQIGRVGFVPTMGALHRGHLELVEKAASVSDVVLTSVFVNPTQFAPHEDLDKYPRSLERDVELCGSHGASAVFAPSPEEMYPKYPPYRTYVIPAEAHVEHEGSARPGFFRGVATAVTKLLNLTRPAVAVFGQKDAQQALLVKSLVRDLHLGSDIIIAPTTREDDGLAMSSRNAYLSQDERKVAPALFRALSLAAEAARQPDADLSPVVDKPTSAPIASSLSPADVARRHIAGASPLFTHVDYVAFFCALTGKYIPSIDQSLARNGAVVCAAAVKLGNTRLIDNVLVVGQPDDIGEPTENPPHRVFPHFTPPKV